MTCDVAIQSRLLIELRCKWKSSDTVLSVALQKDHQHGNWSRSYGTAVIANWFKTVKKKNLLDFDSNCDSLMIGLLFFVLTQNKQNVMNF